MRRLWIVLVLVLMNPACANEATTSKTLSLKLDVDQAALESGQIVLLATLSNQSRESKTFLPWNTPLEGRLRGDYLDIREQRSGARLPYQGIMVKRAAPTADDYLTLGASDSVQRTTDLTTSYGFCPNSDYIIAFHNPLRDKSGQEIEFESHQVTFKTGQTPNCDADD